MKKSTILALALALMMLFPTSATRAMENRPPVVPPASLPTSDGTEEGPQILEFGGVHVVRQKTTSVAPMIAPMDSRRQDQGSAYMIAGHELWYQYTGGSPYNYNAWTKGSTETNYVSDYITVFIAHKWGSSCQNTAYINSNGAEDATLVSTETSPVGTASGTQQCVYGTHVANKVANPYYYFDYSATFPTYTLP